MTQSITCNEQKQTLLEISTEAHKCDNTGSIAFVPRIEPNHEVGDEEGLGNPHSYKQLMGMNIPRPIAAVEGLLYEGQAGVLAGAFAVGKTFFALQLSVCMATGKSFLGRKVNRPYRVSYLDTENGATEICSRLSDLMPILELTEAELKLSNSNWNYTDTNASGQLCGLSFDGKGFGTFIRHIERDQPEAVFVDCYGKVMNGEEKDEAETKAFVKRVLQLQKQHRCLQGGVIVFLHHLTKPSQDHGGGDLLEDPRGFLGRVRGSGRLLDLLQVRLAIDEQDLSNGTSIHVLNGFLRSGRVDPCILQRHDSGFFVVLEDKGVLANKAFGKRKVQYELYQQTANALRTAPAIKHGAVEEFRNKDNRIFHLQTISDTLSTACAHNLLKKNADGSYSLPHVNR